MQMIRLLADLSLRTKGGVRICQGLLAPLREAAQAKGWHVDFVVGCDESSGQEHRADTYILPNRSDLVTDEAVLPRVAAGYDVLYTQRETLRLAKRRPRVVLQLHEHQHTRYAPWNSVRQALRGSLQHYRASIMYQTAEHICFSSKWTRDEFARLEGREPKSSSVVLLGGWKDDCPHERSLRRDEIVVVVASNDARDELAWALDVWRKAALPAPWTMCIVGRRGSGPAGVSLIGPLGDSDLRGLLSRSRAYLHIGRVEGFGLSVVEALQVGTPVIARSGSAVDELLGSGGGYLVTGSTSAAAALVKVADGKAAADLRDPSQVGSQYTWARTAQGIISACEQIAHHTRIH